MAKTANELWFDALVRHQVYLMRLSGGTRNDINGLLNETERALADRVHAVLAGNTKLSPARLRKAEALIEQLKQIRAEVWIEVDGLWKDTMKNLTTTEVEQVNRMLKTVSPAELSTQLPTATKLTSLVRTLPFEGRVLGSWSKKIAADDIGRISSQVRIGVVQGETTTAIARRLIGSAKLKGADGVTQITRRNAEAITRTAVNSYSNAAREMFFNENRDIFNKEVYVATLDGRTTAICRSLDGQRFPVIEGPMPPLHFQCRSLRVAEINGELIGMRPAKSATEKMVVGKYAQGNGLGKITKRAQLPRGHKGKYDVYQRAEMKRMTGRVPAKVTYGEWLKKQSVEFQNDVLGPTRGKLFRKGGLSLDKFVDKSGKTIRLDQLQATDAKAFKAAGLTPEKVSAPSVRSKSPGPSTTGDFSKDFTAFKEKLRAEIGMDLSTVDMTKGSDAFNTASAKFQASLKTSSTNTFAKYKDQMRYFAPTDRLKGLVKNQVDSFLDRIQGYSSDDFIQRLGSTRFRGVKVNPKMKGPSYMEGGRMFISKTDARSVWHEMGHAFEQGDSSVRPNLNRWLKSRSGGAQHTLPGYDNTRGWKDKFIDSYVGRIYNGPDTEVLSMGLEQFTDNYRMLMFAKRDFDHFALTMGYLRNAF